MTNSQIKHLAIIPDGNRRWSKKNNIPLEETYFYGCEKMFSLCALLFGAVETLDEISLFFVSLENLKTRPGNELDALFSAGDHFIDLFHANSKNAQVQIHWVGLEDHDFEVKGLRYRHFVEHIKNLQRRGRYTKEVNVLIGYDVRKDIERALEKDRHFKYENLQVNRAIDLIIRSGGFRRLSGFLPLMCQYSEFEFIEKLFLDVEESDVMHAIDNFSRSVRKFGT